jgi:hypothetical protein
VEDAGPNFDGGVDARGLHLLGHTNAVVAQEFVARTMKQRRRQPRDIAAIGRHQRVHRIGIGAIERRHRWDHAHVEHRIAFRVLRARFEAFVIGDGRHADQRRRQRQA